MESIHNSHFSIQKESFIGSQPHSFVLNIAYDYRASQVVLVVKNLPANAGDIGDAWSVPGLGRSPGEGHGNRLQYSSLENPMDKGVSRAAFHRVAKSRHDWSNLAHTRTLMLQWWAECSAIVPINLKIFTLCSFTKKVCDPCVGEREK